MANPVKYTQKVWMCLFLWKCQGGLTPFITVLELGKPNPNKSEGIATGALKHRRRSTVSGLICLSRSALRWGPTNLNICRYWIVKVFFFPNPPMSPPTHTLPLESQPCLYMKCPQNICSEGLPLWITIAFLRSRRGGLEGGSQGWTNLLTLELIEQNESCAEMKRDCKAKGKRGPVSDGRLPRGETVRRHLNMHVTWKKREGGDIQSPPSTRGAARRLRYRRVALPRFYYWQ